MCTIYTSKCFSLIYHVSWCQHTKWENRKNGHFSGQQDCCFLSLFYASKLTLQIGHGLDQLSACMQSDSIDWQIGHWHLDLLQERDAMVPDACDRAGMMSSFWPRLHATTYISSSLITCPTLSRLQVTHNTAWVWGKSNPDEWFRNLMALWYIFLVGTKILWK